MIEQQQFESVTKLSRDLRKAASTLTRNEARFLVDGYYMLQEYRKAMGNQLCAMNKSAEPHDVLQWFFTQADTLENEIRKALGTFAAASRVGQWSLEVCGIGPVIAAGLLAHLDLNPWQCQQAHADLNAVKACTEKEPHEGCHRIRIETAGQIWRFAGLDPTRRWEKGKKRPWNASLKVLCWKIGQSFLKVSTNQNSYYGKLLRERWEDEKARNARMEFADQARRKLENFKIGKSTEAYGHYSGGKLPPAHILQRACRWSTKLFLSHWHAVAYECHFGVPAPRPYVIEHLGHADVTPPPNWPGAIQVD